MEEFSCKTKIISGKGSVNWLKTLGAGRLLLVSDPYFGENGTAQKIMDLSGAEKTEIFCKASKPSEFLLCWSFTDFLLLPPSVLMVF